MMFIFTGYLFKKSSKNKLLFLKTIFKFLNIYSQILGQRFVLHTRIKEWVSFLIPYNSLLSEN